MNKWGIEIEHTIKRNPRSGARITNTCQPPASRPRVVKVTRSCVVDSNVRYCVSRVAVGEDCMSRTGPTEGREGCGASMVMMLVVTPLVALILGRFSMHRAMNMPVGTKKKELCLAFRRFGASHRAPARYG